MGLKEVNKSAPIAKTIHMVISKVTIQPSTRNRGVTANERFLRVKQSPKAWFFPVQHEIASGEKRPRNDSLNSYCY
jgi:hypothetical protein